MKAEIKSPKLILTYGDKTLELTEEEAKAIKDVLNEHFKEPAGDFEKIFRDNMQNDPPSIPRKPVQPYWPDKLPYPTKEPEYPFPNKIWCSILKI